MSSSSPGWCPFAERVTGVTAYESGSFTAVGFCDHTAGGFYSTLRRASFWNGAGYSVHFGVSRKGEICQLVNIFDKSWGQGRIPDDSKVSWPPYDTMGRRNPNQYLISIEHEDAEIVDGRTRFIPGSEWTSAQYLADLRLKHWCIDEYRLEGYDLLRFGIDSLAGHHMFDPRDRAECPGRFWRDVYRLQLYRDLTGGGNELANLNADGSDRIVSEDGRIVIYKDNVPVIAIGGPTPGQVAKNFGGTWLYLRGLLDGGEWAETPYFSPTPGD